jgi:hypothetical protein
MISVKLLKPLAGVDFSMPAGTVFKTNPEEAQRLIRDGIAEVVSTYEKAQETQNKTTRGIQGNDTERNRTTDQVRGKKLPKG